MISKESSVLCVKELPKEGNQAIFDFLLIFTVSVQLYFQEGFFVLNPFCYEERVYKKIKNEYKEPSTRGMERNRSRVAAYIGCLTMPYNPVSITVWFSCTCIVRLRYVFSLNTSA